MAADPSDFDTSEFPTEVNKMNPTTIVDVDGVSVEVSTSELRFEAGAEIDCDGAPNAYALPGSGLTGLDNIRNALHNINDPLILNNDGVLIPPTNGWAGVVVDANGDPIIQLDGPYAGFCLSATALQDHNYAIDDYRRYVDASKIPYISIPPQLHTQFGVQLGDAALVCYRGSARSIQCVVGDIGPRRKLGEISVAAAAPIGVNSSPRNGGTSHGVIVRIFVGSAKTPAWDNRRTAADVAAFVDAFASQA